MKSREKILEKRSYWEDFRTKRLITITSYIKIKEKIYRAIQIRKLLLLSRYIVTISSAFYLEKHKKANIFKVFFQVKRWRFHFKRTTMDQKFTNYIKGHLSVVVCATRDAAEKRATLLLKGYLQNLNGKAYFKCLMVECHKKLKKVVSQVSHFYQLVKVRRKLLKNLLLQ